MGGLFLESLNYQDSAATNIINGFSPQNSSKSVMFWTEFKMEEVELVVAEEYLKIERNKRRSNFWNIWTFTNPMHGFKKKRFAKGIAVCKQKVIDGIFGWRNHTSSY